MFYGTRTGMLFCLILSGWARTRSVRRRNISLSGWAKSKHLDSSTAVAVARFLCSLVILSGVEILCHPALRSNLTPCFAPRSAWRSRRVSLDSSTRLLNNEILMNSKSQKSAQNDRYGKTMREIASRCRMTGVVGKALDSSTLSV